MGRGRHGGRRASRARRVGQGRRAGWARWTRSQHGRKSLRWRRHRRAAGLRGATTARGDGPRRSPTIGWPEQRRVRRTSAAPLRRWLRRARATSRRGQDTHARRRTGRGTRGSATPPLEPGALECRARSRARHLVVCATQESHKGYTRSSAVAARENRCVRLAVSETFPYGSNTCSFESRYKVKIRGEISIRIGAETTSSTHPKTQKACVYCETRVTVKCEVCLCRGRGDARPASVRLGG